MGVAPYSRVESVYRAAIASIVSAEANRSTDAKNRSAGAFPRARGAAAGPPLAGRGTFRREAARAAPVSAGANQSETDSVRADGTTRPPAASVNDVDYGANIARTRRVISSLRTWRARAEKASGPTSS